MILAKVVLHRPNQEPEETAMHFKECQPHILEILRIGTERFEILSVEYNFIDVHPTSSGTERYFPDIPFYTIEARLL